jgi:hypothetical protein
LEPSDESKPVVILIVEDEMIVRMSTTDILQDAGYLVLEARDGVEAIAMIELRDDVAALFTDVTMPNMNGNRARPSCSREMAAHWHRGHVRGAPTQREAGAARGRSLSREAVQAEGAAAGHPSGVAQVGSAVAIRSLPTMQAGKLHGADGLAQPLPESDE